jgi:hypothetical protein
MGRRSSGSSFLSSFSFSGDRSPIRGAATILLSPEIF